MNSPPPSKDLEAIEPLKFKFGTACRHCMNFSLTSMNYGDRFSNINNPLAIHGLRCKLGEGNLIECTSFTCATCTIVCNYVNKEEVKNLQSDPFICSQCKGVINEKPLEVAVVVFNKGKLPGDCPCRYGAGILTNSCLCNECSQHPREDKTSEIRVTKEDDRPNYIS